MLDDRPGADHFGVSLDPMDVCKKLRGRHVGHGGTSAGTVHLDCFNLRHIFDILRFDYVTVLYTAYSYIASLKLCNYLLTCSRFLTGRHRVCASQGHNLCARSYHWQQVRSIRYTTYQTPSADMAAIISADRVCRSCHPNHLNNRYVRSLPQNGSNTCLKYNSILLLGA